MRKVVVCQHHIVGILVEVIADFLPSLRQVTGNYVASTPQFGELQLSVRGIVLDQQDSQLAVNAAVFGRGGHYRAAVAASATGVDKGCWLMTIQYRPTFLTT